MNEPQTPALDQASFRRVWQRVMPQDRMDCPFTLEEPQAEAVKASALPPQPVPAPAVPAPLPPRPAPTLPTPTLCLGDASAPGRTPRGRLGGRTGGSTGALPGPSGRPAVAGSRCFLT